MNEVQTQTPGARPMVLRYWKVRGIAQPLRHLMEVLKLEYVQKTEECPMRYFTKEVEEVKKRCLSTNLPVLDDNGFMVAQPIAIAKYLCKKAGRIDLLGHTIVDQCRIDELFSRFAPHRNRMCDKVNHYLTQGQASNKKLLMKECSEYLRGSYMESLRKTFQSSHGGWFLGYLTIADFFIYETTFYIQGLFPNEYSQIPELQNFKENFEELPAIKAYQASGREPIDLFIMPLGDLWNGNPKYK